MQAKCEFFGIDREMHPATPELIYAAMVRTDTIAKTLNTLRQHAVPPLNISLTGNRSGEAGHREAMKMTLAAYALLGHEDYQKHIKPEEEAELGKKINTLFDISQEQLEFFSRQDWQLLPPRLANDRAAFGLMQARLAFPDRFNEKNISWTYEIGVERIAAFWARKLKNGSAEDLIKGMAASRLPNRSLSHQFNYADFHDPVRFSGPAEEQERAFADHMKRDMMSTGRTFVYFSKKGYADDLILRALKAANIHEYRLKNLVPDTLTVYNSGENNANGAPNLYIEQAGNREYFTFKKSEGNNMHYEF